MSLSRVQDELISVGDGARIDKSAVVGERPERELRDYRLALGPGATLRSGTIIYAGSIIGAGFNTGHNVVVREQARIGDGVSVWSNSVIDYGCEIGDGVKIHTSVYVAQFTRIGARSFLGPGVMIANDPHPGCPHSRECMRGPLIGCDVQIGINVTILPFVSIGDGALIGAGSVVTRDVPPRTVVYGNPAKVGGNVDDLECIVVPKLIERPYGRR
jgi:acetyltransferase-like isoleucine patch superfamily enzyme